MTNQNINDLLAKAEEAIDRKDLQGAGFILKHVIEQDFTNQNAWRMLHNLLAPNEPIDQFRYSFSQKYYPSKINLLDGVTDQRDKNVNLPESESNIGKKKCPYCAETILADAIVCRFCGRNLTGESPDVIDKKQSKLNKKIPELEKSLASWERYLQEQKQLEDDAKRQVNWAWVGIIIGIFLSPIIIGIIIIIAGVLALSTNGKKRDNARNNQLQALKHIEGIKQSLSQVRAELRMLK